jgi:hypothetical protein
MFRLRVRDNLWMAIGAALLLVLILVILRFNQYGQTATQAAFQARRLDLVSQARLALASASEAEKSAVMAITDEDSQGYADQARAATTQAESARRELQRALNQKGTSRELDLFAQFSEVFSQFQRIDSDLLALAVKNTNLKAYGLAFGPAEKLIDEMNEALSKIVTKSADWPESRAIALLALGAESAALRIQILLAPHIAEESDKKMDELEAQMSEQARVVQKALDALATLPKIGGDPDMGTAASAYRRYGVVRTQILALSRENTNVRSLSISLSQKRRVMLLCQETLAALQQAITEESASGEPHRRPPSPR